MKQISAALLLIAASATPASAFSESQNTALEVIARVVFAGTGDRCPRYRLIRSALGEELRARGFTEDDVKTKDFDDSMYVATTAAQIKYNLNPSAFCHAAWELFGPDGSYRRQMLEAR